MDPGHVTAVHYSLYRLRVAQKATVQLVDDLDGDEAIETVVFGFDGPKYEIDLNLANADRLRRALKPFAAARRKLRTVGKFVLRAVQGPPATHLPFGRGLNRRDMSWEIAGGFPSKFVMLTPPIRCLDGS
jgi:hypothetical protein